MDDEMDDVLRELENRENQDDEMDDVLKELENGENPVLNALQKEKKRDAETASKLRAFSKAALGLGVAAVAGGGIAIGSAAAILPAMGAIAGGVLLSASASAWAVSKAYDSDDDNEYN